MAAAVVVVVAKEMANTKQTVEAEAKTQQSTIKKQKIGSDDGRSGVAAICGGRKCGDGCGGGHGNGRGQQGGGVAGRRRRPQRQSLRSAAVIILRYYNHRSTGESWSNTSPNNDGGGGRGGGGGGGKNRHTPSPNRRRTAILPDCTNSRGGVLNVVHCRCVSVSGGGVHPSNDQKDNDESGRCGGTVSIW